MTLEPLLTDTVGHWLGVLFAFGAAISALAAVLARKMDEMKVARNAAFVFLALIVGAVAFLLSDTTTDLASVFIYWATFSGLTWYTVETRQQRIATENTLRLASLESRKKHGPEFGFEFVSFGTPGAKTRFYIFNLGKYAADLRLSLISERTGVELDIRFKSRKVGHEMMIGSLLIPFSKDPKSEDREAILLFVDVLGRQCWQKFQFQKRATKRDPKDGGGVMVSYSYVFMDSGEA